MRRLRRAVLILASTAGVVTVLLSPAVAGTSLPVGSSVDRVVSRMEDARRDPCLAARQRNLPCFLQTTTVSGRRVAVGDSLSRVATAGPPAACRLTAGDERRGCSPASVHAGGVSVDSGCAARSVVKALQGKNDTYYLYRVRDRHGSRVALYDRRIVPTLVQGDAELLGELKGECDAIEEWRTDSVRTESPSGGR